MIAILRDQHMRQKAGARSAALDRSRRQRRLVELLAAAAGQARTDDALHHEAAGDVLQFLGDILAETLETAAAVRRSVRPAREPSPRAAGGPEGDGAWAAASLAGRRLGYGASAACAISSSSIPSSSWSRASELAPKRCRRRPASWCLSFSIRQIAVAQLGVPCRQFGPRGQHHRLQRGDVIGQGIRASLRAWPHPSRKGLPEGSSNE